MDKESVYQILSSQKLVVRRYEHQDRPVRNSVLKTGSEI